MTMRNVASGRSRQAEGKDHHEYREIHRTRAGVYPIRADAGVARGASAIHPLHLLKVLLDDSEGLAGGLIDRSGGDSRAILKSTEDTLAKMPKVSGSARTDLSVAVDCADLRCRRAGGEKAGDSFVTVERLLLALALDKDSDCGALLKKGGVTRKIHTAINALRKGAPPTALGGKCL